MLKTWSSARRTRPRWAPPASTPSPCSARTSPRTSWALSGSVSSRSGWPPSAGPHRRDPGLRGRARRAGRPRLHPHRDRHPADIPVSAGLDPGRAGRRVARRRLAVPRRHRRLRPVPARRPRRPATAPCPATTPAGTPSRWTPCARSGRPRRFVPGLGHHVHKDGDPRTPRLFADRRRGGPVRSAPVAVRRDRPRAPAGAGQDAAAQRRRRVRRGAGRPGPAAGAAARVRPARPHRRADRAARRGAAPPGGQRRLPVRRPEQPLRRPRPVPARPVTNPDTDGGRHG